MLFKFKKTNLALSAYLTYQNSTVVKKSNQELMSFSWKLYCLFQTNEQYKGFKEYVNFFYNYHRKKYLDGIKDAETNWMRRTYQQYMIALRIYRKNSLKHCLNSSMVEQNSRKV